MGLRGPAGFFSAVVVIALSTVLAAPAVASDDVNPEIANCEELKDEATVEQANTCKLHLFCEAVFKIQKVCTKAKTFLNKLKNLSFRKDKLDSSDVFDAAAPSAEGDTAFNRISAAIKSKFDSQPKKEILTGQDRVDGKDVKWVYEGPVKDGKRDGTGVLTRESGEVFRGDFVQGKQAGKGDQFFESGKLAGNRYAGDMIDEQPDGSGVVRMSTGARYEGGIRGTVLEGKGVLTTPSGMQIEGDFKGGLLNGHGVVKTSRGDITEGEFRNGKPYNAALILTDGKRINYVNGAVTFSNDPPQSAATSPGGSSSSSLGGKGTTINQGAPSAAPPAPVSAPVPVPAQPTKPAATAGTGKQPCPGKPGEPEWLACTSCKNHPMGEAACTEGVYAMFGKKPPGGSTGGGGDCKTLYDRQEAEFAAINRRISATTSIVEQSQLALGMMRKRMDLLDRHCKGQPQYAEYASMKQSYDGTLRACRGMASNPGDCVPK